LKERSNFMKKMKVSVGLALVAGGLFIMVNPANAGFGISLPSVVVTVPTPVVTVQAAPVVVAAPVAVAAPEVALVPETYVWDGAEFVGEVGGVTVFLGPEGGWHQLDAVRLERFHGWERGHGDWRRHALHNDKYRNVHVVAVAPAAPVVVAPVVAAPVAPATVAVAPVAVTPAPVVVAPVVVAAPEVVLVPETYVWDGVEFVGEVGGVPVFRGPDGGWHHLDAVRLERFNGWAHAHGDWRSHAIHNDKFVRVEAKGNDDHRDDRRDDHRDDHH
jgi:hypothetical protein